MDAFRWFLLVLLLASLLVYLFVGPPTQWLGTERSRASAEVGEGAETLEAGDAEDETAPTLRGDEAPGAESNASAPTQTRVAFRVTLTEVPHPDAQGPIAWKQRPAANVEVALVPGFGAISTRGEGPSHVASTDAEGQLVLGPLRLPQAATDDPLGCFLRITDSRVLASAAEGRLPWVLWSERSISESQQELLFGSRSLQSGLGTPDAEGVIWVTAEARIALGREVRVRWIDAQGEEIADLSTDFLPEGTQPPSSRTIDPNNHGRVLPVPWRGRVAIGYGRRWQGRAVVPPTEHPLVIEESGPPLVVDVPIPGVRTVSGSLSRPDGTPAADVLVQILPTGWTGKQAEMREHLSSTAWDSYRLRVRTDAEGRFRAHFPKEAEDTLDVEVPLHRGDALSLARAVGIGSIGDHRVALHHLTLVPQVEGQERIADLATVDWRVIAASGSQESRGQLLSPPFRLTALAPGDQIECVVRLDGHTATEYRWQVPASGGDEQATVTLTPLGPDNDLQLLIESPRALPDTLPPFDLRIVGQDNVGRSVVPVRDGEGWRIPRVPPEAFTLETPGGTGTPRAPAPFRFLRSVRTDVAPAEPGGQRIARMQLVEGGAIAVTVRAAWQSWRPFPILTLKDDRGEQAAAPHFWHRREGDRWVMTINGRTALDQRTESPLLAAGQYVLEVSWDGYETERRIVDVELGKTAELEVTLKKK